VWEGERETMLWGFSRLTLRGQEGETSESLRDGLTEIEGGSVCVKG
jgi:hypothetical protein